MGIHDIAVPLPGKTVQSLSAGISVPTWSLTGMAPPDACVTAFAALSSSPLQQRKGPRERAFELKEGNKVGRRRALQPLDFKGHQD